MNQSLWIAGFCSCPVPLLSTILWSNPTKSRFFVSSQLGARFFVSERLVFPNSGRGRRVFDFTTVALEARFLVSPRGSGRQLFFPALRRGAPIFWLSQERVAAGSLFSSAMRRARCLFHTHTHTHTHTQPHTHFWLSFSDIFLA